MKIYQSPSGIKGHVTAAPSKSHFQRLCAAALLSGGKTTIYNPGKSNDDLVALGIIKSMGARISAGDNCINIDSSNIEFSASHVHSGESGLSLRMFTPILSLFDHEIEISGEGSLVTRPIKPITDVIENLGAAVSSNKGKLPIKVKGPQKEKDIILDGSLSSQVLTGVLFSYAYRCSAHQIEVIDLKSKPYIDLTLKVLKAFGVDFSNDNYKSFAIKNYSWKKEVEITAEGDWSGAAFLLVAGAVGGAVTVSGLSAFSAQADKKIIDALLDAGAEVKVGEIIEVKKGELNPFYFDATDCPDLFPPLVALAANCKGITKIKGVSRLAHKESDRGLTLKEEFDKLGISILLDGDFMMVDGSGGIKVKNHTLNSHHDHRIAMAGSVAALNADFDVSIRNADAINKSYPDFYGHMQSLGAIITIEN